VKLYYSDIIIIFKTLTKYLFLVLYRIFEGLNKKMDEDHIASSSEATVGCDIKEEVIGAERETEDQQNVEVIINADGKLNSQESGCESESIVIDLKADETTWKHIQRMPAYVGAMKRAESEVQVIIVHSGFGINRVEIRGTFHDAIMKAKGDIESIFEECKQEVRTVVLPELDQDMYSRVISFLEDSDTQSRCTLTLELQKVILTGKARDIDQLLGLLEETFGVTGAMPLTSDDEENICPINKQLEEIQDTKSSPELLDNSSRDDVDNELYGTEKSEFIELEDDALTVDEKIWCYMEKHPDYSESVKLIKDKSNLSIMLEPVNSSKESNTNRVRLVFTGSDEAEVRASVHKTKSLIKQCQGAGTMTLQVPCPEPVVHQKITKLLKSINRLPSYVTVEPEMIAVTGNTVEIENCLEKLKTYGLIYEIPHEEPPSNVLIDDGEDRPVQEVVDNMNPENMHQERTENSALLEHFEHYRQLPVPIEEFLWLYIDRRRKQELSDLRKDYNLQIIADGADMPDFVSITLASNSIDMLDCGQDAIISLIVHLRQQIVLGVLDTASPEDLPQELQGMLQQQCRDMESVIVLKGSKICIIGPNEEAMKCQQLVAAFMQKAVSDAGNMGYDTSNMTSVGYNGELETGDYTSAGETLNPGYYGEGRNGTLLGDASLQREQAESGDAELRHAGGDRYGTFHNVSETVTEANHTGSQYREPSKRTDDEVPEEVLPTDTAAVRQQTPANPDKESATNGPHLKPTVRLNGTSEKTNYHSGGSHLEKEHNDRDCSICHGDNSLNRREVCHHHYCLSCVHLYFGERECPVCGTVELSSKQKISQPDNGLMLTTYDNSFKLPGYESSSRGTIVVTYAFPPGTQSVRYRFLLQNFFNCLDRSEVTLLVLFDVSAAFDSVDQNILLQPL